MRFVVTVSAILAIVAVACESLAAAERKLPEAAKAVFDAADSVTAYSLEPAKPKRTIKETFHGWIVLGKTGVKDAGHRRILLGRMEKLITNPGKGGEQCFTPHQALRVAQGDKCADFVISLECGWVDVYSDNKDTAERIEISLEVGEWEMLRNLFFRLVSIEPDPVLTGRLALEKANSRKYGGIIKYGTADCVDINHDGTEILVGSNHALPGAGLEIYEAESLKLKRRFPVQSAEAAFTLDGKQILSVRGSFAQGEPDEPGVKVIDASTGVIESVLEIPRKLLFDRRQNLLAYGRRGELALFDRGTKTVVQRRHYDRIISPHVQCISATGVVAFLVPPDAAALLWLPPYDKEPVVVPVGVYAFQSELHVSPDAKLLAVVTNSDDYSNSFTVWDVQSKTRLHEFAHTAGWGQVRNLKFSPDGAFLVSLSSMNSREQPEVIVLETKEFKEVGRAVVAERTAHALCWFPDSKRFVTGSDYDGSIKVWRIQDEPAKPN